MKRLFPMSVILLITLFSIRIDAQVNYDVPITFTVTETGVNRFITKQWSGITTSWSGSYQGLNYSIVLDKPTISLSQNSIKITFRLSCSTSIYNGDISITPTLTIPSTTISANKIISEYLNLRQQIDAIAEFTDSRLKDVIEDILEPIDWVMYEGKILTTSTGRLLQVADIKWVGLPVLSFEVANSEINITITPTIQSIAPTYTFQYKRTSSSGFGVRILSNNQVLIDVSKLNKIYTGIGEEINVTLQTELPAIASWDSNLQKYVVEIFYTANVSLASQHIYSRLKLKRNNMETLWVVDFALLLYSWSDTNFSAIRGE